MIWIDQYSASEPSSPGSIDHEETVVSTSYEADQVPASEEDRNDAREFLVSFFAKLKRQRETGQSSSDEEADDAKASGSESSSGVGLHEHSARLENERRSHSERMPGDQWQSQRSLGYCELCDRSFDTRARYLQHCKSLQHQKLANNEPGEKDSRIYLCELCQVTTVGLVTLEAHIDGRRHLAAYEQFKYSGSTVPEHLVPPSLRGAGATGSSSLIASATMVDSPLQSIKYRSQGSQWSVRPAVEERAEWRF